MTDSFKTDDWVIWAGYICRIKHISDTIILSPVSSISNFNLSLYRVKEMTKISEQEAILFLLKDINGIVDDL